MPHGVSDHRQCDCLLNSLFRLPSWCHDVHSTIRVKLQPFTTSLYQHFLTFYHNITHVNTIGVKTYSIVLIHSKCVHLTLYLRIHVVWSTIKSPYPTVSLYSPIYSQFRALCEFKIRGPFYVRYFHGNSNSMEISFCSHPSCGEAIAIKCCTWHDSCAVVACAKLYSNTIPYNGVTLKPNCRRIWISVEKSFLR